jgi:hypothetical protein
VTNASAPLRCIPPLAARDGVDVVALLFVLPPFVGNMDVVDDERILADGVANNDVDGKVARGVVVPLPGGTAGVENTFAALVDNASANAVNPEISIQFN